LAVSVIGGSQFGMDDANERNFSFVMPALVAGIHVLNAVPVQRRGWPGLRRAEAASAAQAGRARP
jgi:hypothetical protein